MLFFVVTLAPCGDLVSKFLPESSGSDALYTVTWINLKAVLGLWECPEGG